MRILLLFLAIPAVLAAAPLAGVVRSAGQAIPGATVTAILGDKTVTTTTNEQGQYKFGDLGPGNWKIEVQMFGFAPGRGEIAIGTDPVTKEWALGLRPRMMGRGGPGGPGGGARGGAGFQNVDLNQSATMTELQNLATAQPEPATPMSADSN